MLHIIVNDPASVTICERQWRSVSHRIKLEDMTGERDTLPALKNSSLASVQKMVSYRSRSRTDEKLFKNKKTQLLNATHLLKMRKDKISKVKDQFDWQNHFI